MKLGNKQKLGILQKNLKLRYIVLQRPTLTIKAEVTTPHITYVQPLMRYGAPTIIVKFLGLQDKVYYDAGLSRLSGLENR